MALAKLGSQSDALPGSLNRLAKSLFDRHSRSGNTADLDTAIQYWERAVAETPPGEPEFIDRLNSLAVGLHLRYRVSRKREDLDRTIQYWEQTISSRSAFDQDRATFRSNLGRVLVERYEESGDVGDLERGVQLCEDAVAIEPANPLQRPSQLHRLADALRVRFAHTGAQADFARARGMYERACTEGVEVHPQASLTSSNAWLEWAFERGAWDEVIDAYRHGRSSIRKILQIQIRRRDKAAWLRRHQGSAMRACYAHAQKGQLVEAVTVLEDGRARLMSEVLERSRADLEQLKVRASALYAEYDGALARLVELEQRSERSVSSLSGGVDFTVEIRAAVAELERVAATVRGVAGFEGFLQTSSFEEARAAVRSASDAVVYVVTTPKGTLALAITRQSVEALPLEFTDADLAAALVKREREIVTGGYLPAQLYEPAWLASALDELLPWLGERILGPLAARLTALGVEDVILIPTGQLALLPLHAGTYPRHGNTAHFLDEFAVTYSPNARVSVLAQRKLHLQDAPPRLVGVANPLPHAVPLPGAAAELEAVARLFPRSDGLLYGTEATRSALLRVLPLGTHLHFACHCGFDVQHPMASRFELSGGEALSLRDFLDGDAARLPARLAVLSACQSAVSDVRELPDELLGLPAGLLQAGVAGVVGTLWPVADLSTALVVAKFYQLQLAANSRDPLSAGRSLAAAQRWLRDVTNGELLAYFQRLRDTATEETRAEEFVEAGLAQFAAAPAHERPFGGQPYHWAPFVFVGA